MSSGLMNDRQRAYFLELQRKKIPKDLRKIMGNDHYLSLDLLNALLYAHYDRKSLSRVWVYRDVLPKVWEKTASMSKEAIHSFLTTAFANLFDRYNTGAMLLPFSSHEGDFPGSLKTWNALLNAYFFEEMHFDEYRKRVGHVGVLINLLIFSDGALTWDNLTEAVRQDLGESRKIFNKVLAFFSLQHLQVEFASRSSVEFNWTRERFIFNELNDHMHYVHDIADSQTTLIPVPDFCTDTCNRWLEQIAVEVRQKQRAHEELISWFGAYIEDFQATARMMWQDICDHPKYGLRPGGRDLVVIDVPALRQYGYRYLQLFPEEQFPKSFARYWILLEFADIRTSTTRTLHSGELRTFHQESLQKAGSFWDGYRETYNGVQEDPESFIVLVDKLQSFIAIHCLWKIVTGQIFTVKPKASAKGETRRAQLMRSFLVRPHFRWLPPGYQPSERAQTRSIECFGYNPPEGRTFVMSDPDEAYQASIKEGRPVMKYTEADLGFAVEQPAELSQ